MAVTINTASLSTNAKYLSYSESTANTDAKTFCIAISDALTALNWTRFDTAGADAVLGTDSDSVRVLRRPTADNAVSGNYQYLGIKISQGGSANAGANYRVQFIYAADWTNAASATAFVNPIRLPHGNDSSYWKNDAAGPYVDTMLLYNSGGTLWLFNGPNLTTFVFTSSSIPNDGGNVFAFGEYDKSFGEQMPTASDYLHNGIAFNGREFSDHSGAPSHSVPGIRMLGRGHYNSTFTDITLAPLEYRMTAPVDSYSYSINSSDYGEQTAMPMQRGFSRPQFVCTEYPTTTAGLSGQSYGRDVTGAPEAWNNSYVGNHHSQLATRLHMGWLGWVGHLGPGAYCLTSLGGDTQGYKDPSTGVDTHTDERYWESAEGYSGLFSNGKLSTDRYALPQTSWLAEFGGKSMDSQDEGYVIYEPSIGLGSIGPMKAYNHNLNYNYRSSISSNTNTTKVLTTAYNRQDYAGTAVKFSVMGRIRNLKLSTGFTTNFLSFLDAATIPTDAAGFFQSGGTSTDHWGIPLNNGSTVIMWIAK